MEVTVQEDKLYNYLESGAWTKWCMDQEGKEERGILWKVGKTCCHERGGCGETESKMRAKDRLEGKHKQREYMRTTKE